MLRVIMLTIALPILIVLSDKMLVAELHHAWYCCSECCYAKCLNAECHYGTCHLFRVILLHGILQNDAVCVLLGLLPLCHFGNGLHVEVHYAE
jgi:hypothetical protein